MKGNLRPTLGVLTILVIVYLISRLQHLIIIPVFGDEAIYLRWSQIIKSVETLRFIPVSDGKQPLFMWLTVIFFKFITDPLLAGRLLSVVAGLFNMLTIFLISKIFINQRSAYLAALLYLISPFSFFFDRMALPDGLLSLLGTISLLFSLLLTKYPRLDLSLILGMILGIAWLTKSPAIYFIVLSLISFVFFYPQNIKKIYFPTISICLAFVIYNILRLGPQFSQIAIRNRDYVWGLSDILAHPWDPFWPHLKDVVAIYHQYLSLPVLLAAAVAYIFIKSKPNHYLKIIILWWLLPLLANMAIAKVFTLRYILFTLPSLLIIIAAGVDRFKFSTTHLFLTVIFLYLPGIYFMYQLSTTPQNVRLYNTERGYLTDWTSGWGIKEASAYLKDRAQSVNVIVGTEGYFGTLPDGAQIYTNQVPQLTVFGVGIDINQIPEKLINAKNHGDEVYLLFNRSRLKLSPDDMAKLNLVKSYPKPQQDELLLLRLN